MIKKHKTKIFKYPQELVLRQIIRDIINEMVKDVILNTKRNIKKNNIKNIKDIYKSKYPLVSFSDKMKLFDYNVKGFLKKICIIIKMLKKKKILEKK